MSASTVMLSAVFAGVVATLVTVAIEKWGGVIGGILGTVPSTIVPASIGMYMISTPEEFLESMAIIPFGMMLNAMFLGVWLILPSKFPHSNHLLAKTTTSSIIFWVVCGSALFFALESQVFSNIPPQQLGYVGFFGVFCVALYFNIKRLPAPGGHRKVSRLTLFIRGIMAATAIGFAVALSHLHQPLLAGLASVFPAIFLTTMVALWHAQGPSVPKGAAGPMMLGGMSVAVFALLAMVCFPLFGPWFGAISSWLGAIVLWSVPAFFALQKYRNREHKSLA
jgi:hypothetical protein